MADIWTYMAYIWLIFHRLTAHAADLSLCTMFDVAHIHEKNEEHFFGGQILTKNYLLIGHSGLDTT